MIVNASETKGQANWWAVKLKKLWTEILAAQGVPPETSVLIRWFVTAQNLKHLSIHIWFKVGIFTQAVTSDFKW